MASHLCELSQGGPDLSLGLILSPASWFLGPEEGKEEASGSRRKVVSPSPGVTLVGGTHCCQRTTARAGTRQGEGPPWCRDWGPTQIGLWLAGRAWDGGAVPLSPPCPELPGSEAFIFSPGQWSGTRTLL